MINFPVAKRLSDVAPYKPVHSFTRAKHSCDGVWYCADQVRPWCIYYGYSGHYFKTCREALRYAADRGFIHADMIDKIEKNLNERGYI